MILEDPRGAAEQAERLAVELLLARPELKHREVVVRVRDQKNTEVCRTALDAR